MHHHKLFDDKAALYESSRPTYPTEVYEYLAGLCDSHTLAWDCACGNGQAAIGLIEKFAAVVATDVSKEQIANVKEHDRVSYRVSSAESSIFDNSSFDLVCVAQALHWFDFELFWPEAIRVLKRGGIFSAWGYNFPTIEPEVDRLIQKMVLDIVEPYWAPQNKLIWDHYKDIDFPFRKVDSPEFKMTKSWNLEEYFNFLHSMSATRRCMDEIGSDFFQKAYSNASEVWGETSERKETEFDFVFYAGVNEKV